MLNFALFFQTNLEVSQSQVGIFCREDTAVGILLGQPVGGVAESAAPTGGGDALNVVFGVAEGAVGSAVVDHVRINDMVHSRQLRGGVDQTVAYGVQRFCNDTLLGDPQLFIQSLFDFFRLT